MLTITGIERGVVIDHIKAGKSMEIYNHLHLSELDCSVAIIKNVVSKKSGKKDIIKIQDRVDLDLDVLGYIDPFITVNIIENGKIMKKEKLRLPERLTNVIKCKNPRCITSIEQELPHTFKLVDGSKMTYRCIYCEQEK